MIRRVLTAAALLLVSFTGAAQQTGLTDGQIASAEIEVPELVRLLDLAPGMRVADVGAGFGASSSAKSARC